MAEELVCGTSEVERIAEQMRAAHVRPPQTFPRQFPIGAEPVPTGGVHFRVWAPRSKTVRVQLWNSQGAERPPDQVAELTAEADGYFSGLVQEARAGMLYKFQLDSGSFPDPASRFQPEGPHGPSQILAPRFEWTDENWRGVSREGQVIYEMHIGTFTREGTWRAAMEQLPELAHLGVTLIEVMPVADFVGRFGWGYDGVHLFAPTRLYGSPDDMCAFVNRAHELGIGVILDVVYNHFGPDGNYIGEFSRDYFSNHYECEWGDAINFDGDNSGPVREFFIANAGYWIEEFHLDGLRLDATQQIYDASRDNIMAAIVRRVRAAAGGRGTFIVGENETQETRLVRDPKRGGYGLDALWNDDFHHTAVVAVTGRAEAYYSDYRGTPQEFISAAKWGYLYQGQWYLWQSQRRGSPALDLASSNFVTFIQNHDQIANSWRGHRLHTMTSPGRYRALTALLLLGPNPPMLFQGQEFAASTPFLYFADHSPELAPQVAEGRKKFLQQFKSFACPGTDAAFVDPESEETFLRCKLDFAERNTNKRIYELHRKLLRLRKENVVFSGGQCRPVDGAVLAREAFVLRFFGADGDDRLLIVNLGVDLHLDPAPEPLLAPPADRLWKVILSTESVEFGGGGTPPLESDENWRIPGHAAVALAPEPVPEASVQAQ
jgi:maltooligosyltrehalose trehalohydrolase